MTTEIRTRADGSIDSAFYMARGRQMRSEQALETGHSLWRTIAEAFRRGDDTAPATVEVRC